MHVYFSGIGGAGIGPLALLALDSGYQVSGSDITHSWFIDELIARGAQINISLPDSIFLSEKIKAVNPPTWLVQTSALPNNHPELVLAREAGLQTSKRAEFLLHILKKHNQKLIAVSGTHGKTTTTGMLIWLARQLNISVSYLIGTNISWGPNAMLAARSRWFIYEADEYDRNMLQFHPEIAVVPSLDYDHPDIYPTVGDYRQAFIQFAQQSQVIITSPEIEHLQETEALYPDSALLDDITLPGIHSRNNASLAITAFKQAGLSNDTNALITAINNFPGTARRFEKLADNLYTDYAHHPVEIAATLQLAREISDNVVVVYQPHQDRRQREIRDQYADAFKHASKIYWLPTYEPIGRSSQAPLTQAELMTSLNNSEIAKSASLDESLVDIINKERTEGKLVLCFSAGTLDAFLRDNLV
jgi:UDP-N-acetylmuramate--alanine ligase